MLGPASVGQGSPKIPILRYAFLDLENHLSDSKRSEGGQGPNDIRTVEVDVID